MTRRFSSFKELQQLIDDESNKLGIAQLHALDVTPEEWEYYRTAMLHNIEGEPVGSNTLLYCSGVLLNKNGKTK